MSSAQRRVANLNGHFTAFRPLSQASAGSIDFDGNALARCCTLAVVGLLAGLHRLTAESWFSGCWSTTTGTGERR